MEELDQTSELCFRALSDYFNLLPAAEVAHPAGDAQLSSPLASVPTKVYALYSA
jgi:hypothetical protein